MATDSLKAAFERLNKFNAKKINWRNLQAAMNRLDKRIITKIASVLGRFGFKMAGSAASQGVTKVITWIISFAKRHPVTVGIFLVGMVASELSTDESEFFDDVDVDEGVDVQAGDGAVARVTFADVLKSNRESYTAMQKSLPTVDEDVIDAEYAEINQADRFGDSRTLDLVDDSSFSKMSELRSIIFWARQQYGSLQRALQHHEYETAFLKLQRDDIVRGYSLFGVA